MADLNDNISKLATAFEEFKSTNDTRLAQLESKGSVDPLTESKLTEIKNEMLDLQQQVEDLGKKNNRIGAGDMDADVEAHRSAFNRFARKGDENGLADLQAKALSTADADGGYAIPEVIEAQVRQRVVQINPLRSLCSVVSTGTTDYKTLMNRKGLNSGWVGETDARTATNTPTLQEIKPSYGEIYANPQATQTILDDAMFDVEAWLASDIAEEFARAEGEAFVSGNGTNKPKGFLSGTPVATADASRAAGVLQFIASGQAAALPASATHYQKLIYGTKAQHRAGASFLANSTTICALMSLTDTDGRPLWQPSLVVGQPATFFGHAIYAVEEMPDVAAGAFPLAFGDFKAGYLIADRMGIRTLRDPYSNKPYVGFYATKRVGGTVLDSEAIKLLKISA